MNKFPWWNAWLSTVACGVGWIWKYGSIDAGGLVFCSAAGVVLAFTMMQASK